MTPRKCGSWQEVVATIRKLPKDLQAQPGEEIWFRGASSSAHTLLPSLLWKAQGLDAGDLDTLEQNLFFEFQARARELHERGLCDWDFYFFMRHHGLPTRILDWTDSFATALYFALETMEAGEMPCVWALNPYALNAETWFESGARDLVQPKYITNIKGEFWEYGEALVADGPWLNDGPVAIYPLQISARMRAQRGWFTFHGNNRRPLEVQYPQFVARLDLATPAALDGGREFLSLAGLRPYSVYPDLDHLATEVWVSNQKWMGSRRKRKVRHTGK